MPQVVVLVVPILVIGLLVALWRRITINKEISMLDVMPHDLLSFFLCLVVPLFFLYLFGTLYIRQNDIPWWPDGQFAVWILYFVFLIIFVLNIIHIRLSEANYSAENVEYTSIVGGEDTSFKFAWWIFTLLSCLFFGFTVAFSYLQPRPQVAIIISLTVGVGFGLVIFLISLKQALSGVRLLWVEKPWRRQK